MRILVVGSDHKAALELYYLRYFTEAGIENDIFPVHRRFYDYYNASILNKIKFKLGLSGIYKRLNRELLRAVEKYKPTVLLVFKGMEIFPETLQELREKKIRLANYNPDNPLLFSGSGSGNENITNSIPLFNLHITYDWEIKDKLEKQYNKRVGYVPFGFDISDELLQQCMQQQEIIKACFLGNPDTKRSDFLNEVAEGGIPIDIFGSTWNRFKLHENITVHGPVYGDDFWKVLRRYRVQLNFMRPHNPNSHNMRTFEVAGVGGIGLFPATRDHQIFFKENEELFLFTDAQDCIQKAKAILSLPAEDAVKVRTRVRQRCLVDGYSYKDRTQAMIELLSSL